MKTFLLILIIVFAGSVILSLALGMAYLAYWLTLRAGAPKYVAVIVGIAIFAISGWVSNLSSGRNK